MNAIKTKNLTKYYGKVRGIEKLNLSVEEGECFGFIGPNGAGKSTTIRVMLGLISATSGKAEIMGNDISSSKDILLKNVGYLPSETFFYKGMRVREILKLSADLRKADCSKECNDLCERLNLDVSKKVDELSFGNRKKVGIVCAMQHNPRLLVLDEATSGLDPLMQHEFFEIIREKNREGATVFLSSHILSEIQRNCSRAAIIREGRIIACDTVERLSKTKTKRVTINGSINLFDTDDIFDYCEKENLVSFLYSGGAENLINILKSGNVRDFTVSEPDLEEIFMHYYKAEETDI